MCWKMKDVGTFKIVADSSNTLYMKIYSSIKSVFTRKVLYINGNCESKFWI